MRVKALQNWCDAQEGVVTCIRKHNTNLKNKQEQYKEAFHSLNGELKEVREKLAEESHRKGKLKEELLELTPSGGVAIIHLPLC